MDLRGGNCIGSGVINISAAKSVCIWQLHLQCKWHLIWLIKLSIFIQHFTRFTLLKVINGYLGLHRSAFVSKTKQKQKKLRYHVQNVGSIMKLKTLRNLRHEARGVVDV